jgi:hypothetical protein
MTLAVDLMDVALKAIPGKSVKRNEERMWCEMRVLHGLVYPDIVRPISPHVRPTLHPFLTARAPSLIVVWRLTRSFRFAAGQILRMLRVAYNVLSRFRARTFYR